MNRNPGRFGEPNAVMNLDRRNPPTTGGFAYRFRPRTLSRRQSSLSVHGPDAGPCSIRRFLAHYRLLVFPVA